MLFNVLMGRRNEQAVAAGEGGAFLREEGLYSSLMSEWRRARDAGLLQGGVPGESVGRPSVEQAEAEMPNGGPLNQSGRRSQNGDQSERMFSACRPF
ncbi:hypothetical protein ABZ671_25060 [Micromonospora sp. NPDC006766]|uniref:hypothetical protein n=1 Tax=Micromonospora sp. NPDC006766 TaxID=3154778 RepID=UPI0033DA9F24